MEINQVYQQRHQYLEGFIRSDIAAATDCGREGKCLIPLLNFIQQPALQTRTHREIREKLFNAGWDRTQHGKLPIRWQKIGYCIAFYT